MPELAELTPKLEWKLYFKTIDVDDIDDVIVGQPEFFERVNELLDVDLGQGMADLPALAFGPLAAPHT